MIRHLWQWSARALLAGAVLGLVGSFTVENAAACSKQGGQVNRQAAYRSSYRMPTSRSANWGTGMNTSRVAYGGNNYHRHHRHHRHHHHWYGGGNRSTSNSQLARHHGQQHHHHHMHRQHA